MNNIHTNMLVRLDTHKKRSIYHMGGVQALATKVPLMIPSMRS